MKTNEELNSFLASLMGWRKYEEESGLSGGYEIHPVSSWLPPNKEPHVKNLRLLPDFFHDLNILHEFIKLPIMEYKKANAYLNNLEALTGGYELKLIEATAAQRVIAILLTLKGINVTSDWVREVGHQLDSQEEFVKYLEEVARS